MADGPTQHSLSFPGVSSPLKLRQRPRFCLSWARSYDAACRLAEEMANPRRTVPIAILGSVVVNDVLGFAYCLVLLFSLGDLDSLLA